ncbi:MAG: hypothetical protein JKY84_05835 [Emcibacteraceae bacterium]|nr:hypothetical protein [Emcibacteraceae bacterium]
MNLDSLKQKELEIALENRTFEIQLFWQRSNYFLVLITALGIGVFSINNNFLSLIISIFAVISSVFWFTTNLGSKFWQESWEVEVTLLAKELQIRSFEKDIDEIVSQVKQSLKNDKKPFLRSWIDKLTLEKYSVTYNMILLSLSSTIIWILISVFLIFEITDLDNKAVHCIEEIQINIE